MENSIDALRDIFSTITYHVSKHIDLQEPFSGDPVKIVINIIVMLLLFIGTYKLVTNIGRVLVFVLAFIGIGLTLGSVFGWFLLLS